MKYEQNLKWLNKIYNFKTETKRNCFSCHSDPKCELYFNPANDILCVYKEVARTDLRNHMKGEGCITLGTMLREYLELNEE